MSKRVQTYETPEIVVTFDPNVCIHSGVCVSGLPAVFDVSRKRWVRPELATPEAVAAQVRRCPSGALQYQRRSRQAATAAAEIASLPPAESPSPDQSGASAPATPEWEAIRSELLRMAEDDRALRAELARDGSLFQGYHPAMRALHDRNADRLGALLERHGWPGRSQVGEHAAHAAWLVLQHAIGHPPLMRRGLALLREAAARGDGAMLEVAMLEDRIRTFEGRPQRYGTQFDWDAQGELSPLAIEDAAHVDERRRAVGLAPLAEDLRRRREEVRGGPEGRPADWATRERERQAWLREVGWR